MELETRRALESLMAFWADAGVGESYADAPVDRLASGPARSIPAARAALPATVQERAVPLEPAQTAHIDEEARAAAAAASTLAELAAAAGALAERAPRLFGQGAPVLFAGPQTALVAVVGDAPDAADEAEGAPFKSPAGLLLRRFVAAAGLEDRTLYLNAAFGRGAGRGAPTTAAALAAARPFVERALALCGVRWLLLTGSAQAMLGAPEGYPALRGAFRPWSPQGGAPLEALVTPPVRMLLSQPLTKRDLWSDLLTLAARVEAADARP